MIQVRFAGLGGQGILLMGEILGEAAVFDKKYAYRCLVSCLWVCEYPFA